MSDGRLTEQVEEPDSQLNVINKELHPNAARLAEKLIMNFGTSLILLSKTLAHRRNDDVVLSNHIEEALDILHQERQQKSWKTWAIALGGAFFGAFIQGFVGELSTGRNPVTIAVYVILGFMGLLLMFVGFQR
jgi:hypothetical protein